MDATTLLRRLNNHGVEVGLWRGNVFLKASEQSPPDLVLEATEHKDELMSTLVAGQSTLRLKKDEPHAWLLRRGDPPLLACGSQAWCDLAMKSAHKFGDPKELQRWVVLSPGEVGKLVADDSGEVFAPNIRTPKGTPPAGPKKMAAIVLSVCKACRERTPHA